MTIQRERPPSPDELDRQLGELTAWSGEEPGLWRKAVEQTERAGKSRISWLGPMSAGRSWRPVAVAACTLALVTVAAAVLLPTLGQARKSARHKTEDRIVLDGRIGDDVEAYKRTDAPKPSLAAAPIWKGYGGEPQAVDGRFDIADSSNGQVLVKAPDTDRAAADRQVVRKATMELTTDDVRGTFAKAAHIVSEAGGEYVENSSLTGEGKTAQATMTLRVAAGRLGPVMTSLRELGTVKAENTTGEDVTAQVVDVESRIRNEQRVEQELLQLLDKRADAPLKDILELRGSLASVRESIERLIGQREKLGRLVSLASVLVVIRTADAPPPPPPQKSGMGEYFTKAVAGSWRSGLEFLADTVAAGVALVVGGLVWWLILAAAAVGVVRWTRRLSARCV